MFSITVACLLVLLESVLERGPYPGHQALLQIQTSLWPSPPTSLTSHISLRHLTSTQPQTPATHPIAQSNPYPPHRLSHFLSPTKISDHQGVSSLRIITLASKVLTTLFHHFPPVVVCGRYLQQQQKWRKEQ